MTQGDLPVSNGVLDSRGRQIPLALVVQWGKQSVWGDHSVRVVCPYCERWHHHGTGATSLAELTGQTRAAHCGSKAGSYRLCYPFEEDRALAPYSYRIDKARGVLETVGVALQDDGTDESEDDVSPVEEGQGDSEDLTRSDGDLSSNQPHSDHHDGDQLPTVEEQMAQLSVEESDEIAQTPDEVWEELMQDRAHQQLLFISYCVNNDLSEVASLLETYKDDPFVKRRDEDGANCIVHASREGHHRMVELLIEKGADINNVDRRGRTPLMEASLFGRIKVVELLLRHGADPHAKDRKGRNAYFYSRPSSSTTRMRGKFHGYKEGHEAEPNRRIIAVKLQQFEPKATDETTSPRSLNEHTPGRFMTTTNSSSTKIEYYKQTDAYDVPDDNKTVARLNRGKLFPVMSASSGWRTDFAVEHILHNRLWRDRVVELCQLIGYSLPNHHHDEAGLPGSYQASHAEKKLVAYYIDQHVVLPSKLFEDIVVEQAPEWIQQEFEMRNLEDLCPKVPTVLRSIQVSRSICDECQRFLAHVRAVLGLSFTVEFCSWAGGGRG